MKDAENNITYVGFAQYIPVEHDANSRSPPQKQIMIETLCTAIGGVGTEIMNFIITYATNRLNLDSIILDSVEGARVFYEKKGFTVDPTRPRLSKSGVVPMILSLQKRVKRGGRRGRRTFRRSSKKRPGLF